MSSARPTDVPSATTESVRFVADARLLSILGEQLIGSERVGILELIKNAYDANARNCVVTIEGVPGMPPETRSLAAYASFAGPIVEVRDDGVGMSRDDLINGWLRPATRSRSEVKARLNKERLHAERRGSLEEYSDLVEALKREHGGRLPLGEKGVGRLATHRLGRHLWLRTKTAGDPLEWELRIDWNAFDDVDSGPKDLSSVELSLKHQAATTDYGPDGSGTVLACYGGREGYSWTHESLVDVSEAIAGLLSARADSRFAVRFATPHVASDLLGRPPQFEAPFRLVALVNESGLAELDLTYDPPGHLDSAPPGFHQNYSIDLRDSNANAWHNVAKPQEKARKPSCGPFIVNVHCWIRDSAWIGPDQRALTKYLEKHGGLAIYRDGVLAQASQQTLKSDWLGLGNRQIKKASSLSYYQFMGEIEIEQSKTLALRDKSSREGMIEAQPFRDLTELVKALMAELEDRTRRVRDQWRLRRRSRPIATIASKKALKTVADVMEVLATSYDFKKDPLKIGKRTHLSTVKRTRLVGEAIAHLPDQLTIANEERSGLIEAAGFGLAVSVGIHEIATIATGISVESKKILKATTDQKTHSAVEHVILLADSLVAETRRLTPLRTTRNEPAISVSVRRAFETARNAFRSSMDEGDIAAEIEGHDFQVRARFGAIAQVFANLIDNAIYWTRRVEGPRTIRVVLDADARTVLLGDSGPGISERMMPVMFEPFYSEKTNPSGLGLFICRHYLGQLGATIRVARSDERSNLRGAQFLLRFKAL